MGWNSWNHFGCNIDQWKIETAGHVLISSGLSQLGYEYVIIDDCWHAPSRDPNPPHKPLADPDRFPDGIKALADKIHAMGLKLGIYSSAGTYTCAKQFGSLGFEEVDAQTWAEWGADYVKYDNCYNEGQAGYDLISYNRYATMSHALNATGRPMVYAMCNWGEDGTWNWAPTIAHTWRMSGDIMDSYDEYDDRCPCETMLNCKLPGFHCSMTRILEYSAPLVQKAGPGQWNDMDMLEVGNGGMTTEEYKMHFAMWAVLKSPLIMGHDMSKMDEATKAIVSNEGLIAINQDPIGIPVNRVRKRVIKNSEGEVVETTQVWSGILEHGAAVAIINTGSSPQTIQYSLFDIYPASRDSTDERYLVESMWDLRDESLGFTQGNLGKELGGHRAKDILTVDIPGHGSVVHRWWDRTSGRVQSVDDSASGRQKVVNVEL